MLKRLRRSFVLDSMIMTGIVLLAGVFVLFVVTESYYKSRTIDAMEAVINAIEIRDTEEGKLDVTIIQNGFAKMYTGNIMVIVTDREGNIEFASSSVKVEDASVITRAVRYVAGTDERNRQGKIPSQNLRYLRSVKGDYNCIALVDLTEEKQNIYFQLTMYVLAAVLVMGVFYLMAEYMSDRSIMPIKQSIEKQNRFIADASHELKTPLTVILANTGILLANPDMPAEERATWLENTKAEAQRMNGLVNDMLSLSRTDGQEAAKTLFFEVVQFSDLVDDCLLSCEALAYERKIQLESEIQPDLKIVADRNKIHQVIMILLDNALKYSEDAGHVSVTLKGREKNAILTVFNDGKPIPESKRQDIFERFFRAEDSHQKAEKEPGGYGLGLSIAKNIVDAHKGAIYLDFSDDSGTCFVLSLPCEENHKAPKPNQGKDASEKNSRKAKEKEKTKGKDAPEKTSHKAKEKAKKQEKNKEQEQHG